MSHDVFISHSSKDKPTADAICAVLESSGARCWIAPRDVTPSMEWGECIIEAIEECRIMVLVFTADANASSQIRREIERAVNHAVPILPFRIEDVLPGKALEFFIGNVHWLDAVTPPLETHLQNLAETVKMLLARMEPRDAVQQFEPIHPITIADSQKDAADSASQLNKNPGHRKRPRRGPSVTAVADPSRRMGKRRNDATIGENSESSEIPSELSGGRDKSKVLNLRRYWVLILTSVVSVLVLAVIIEFITPRFMGSQGTTLPFDITYKWTEIVPLNLLPYYSGQKAYRETGESATNQKAGDHLPQDQTSLYWVWARIRNTSGGELTLKADYDLHDDSQAGCPVELKKNLMPFTGSIAKGEIWQDTFNPPLMVTNSEYADQCNLRIILTVQDSKEDKSSQWVHEFRIRLLPKDQIEWNLKTPSGKPVSQEFLLASLRSWTSSREGGLEKRAEKAKKQAGTLSEEDILKSCYEELFKGASRLTVELTNPYKKFRTYPFEGEKTMLTPGQILGQGQSPEPLEAALLLGAMIHYIKSDQHLTMFILPMGGDEYPAILLAWPVSDNDWKAIDLRAAATLEFKSNIDQSAALVGRIVSEPGFIQSLKADGVHMGSDAKSPSGLIF